MAGTVTGLAVGAVVGVAGGYLGKGSNTTTTTETNTATTTSTTTATTTVAQTPSFMTPPAAIPSSSIKETVDADIVVLGSGPSGCAAAVSAAEQGAKVIMLEAYSSSVAPGGAWGCINTSSQIKAGAITDVSTIVEQLWEHSEGRADYRLLALWANNSGPAMDWMLNIADKTNTHYDYEPVPPPAFGGFYLFGTGAAEFGGPTATSPAGYQMFESYGESLGMQVRFNTRAIQLVRPNNAGAVTGVIAQNSDGTYSQFNAAKAVIICTGDISGNTEMVNYYIPWTSVVKDRLYAIGTDQGDGLAMALWVGANVPDEPGCAMVHFLSTNKPPYMANRPLMYAPNPGLYVNMFGDRFTNETAENDYLAPRVLKQPGHEWWQIFDSTQVTSSISSAVQTMLTTGEVTSADTIEGLAATFGADPTELTAAVNRYNEIVASGKDDPDFGVPATSLKGMSIAVPPYYACESPPDYLVAMHGPLTDTNMQVLDSKNEPIPGLYAAGNAAAGFWGDSYPMSLLSGIAHGRALTTGRIAGLNAATGNNSSDVIAFNAT